jgi:very-short-patch-repair endonuclease
MTEGVISVQKHYLLQRSRELRKNATPQENKLWYQFLRKHPVKFRRQQQIGPYIADFYCPSARIVIELDGSGHFESEGKEYDQWRDAYIAAQEIKILRFTNTEIEKEFEAVCRMIDCAVTPSVSFADSSPARGEL